MFPARINFRWDGEIHGNPGFGWEWIFVRGRGVCVHVGRFGEMMGDDDDDVMRCVWE